jgi:hypothetical protein
VGKESIPKVKRRRRFRARNSKTLGRKGTMKNPNMEVKEEEDEEEKGMGWSRRRMNE